MTETSRSTHGAFGSLRVGIVRLDGWGDERTTGTGSTGYVPIQGDVDDAQSFEGQPFSLIATIAKGCTWKALRPDDVTLWEDKEHLTKMRDSIAKAFETLLKESAEVIIANCGLFMWMHTAGIVAPAMDQALEALGKDAPPRPVVALSTLTMLPGYLPLYGLGEMQRGVVEIGGNEQSKAVVAIFTSDEDACLGILRKTAQLEGTNVFVHADSEDKKKNGGILVVGLNGKNVIGVDRSVEGFEIVTDGTPAFYDTLNPEMELVAKGVKEHYPKVVMGIVECTEVGAYTDTIRAALDAPVFDPIQLAAIHMDTFLDHDYKQDGMKERTEYIADVLSYPVDPDKAMEYLIEVAQNDEDGEEDDEEPPTKKLKTGGDDHVALHRKLIELAKAGQRTIKMEKSAKGSLKGRSGREMHDMRHFKIMQHLFTQAGDDKFKEIREKLKARQKASHIGDFAKNRLKKLHKGLWAKIKANN
jgi:hypothetical protein